MDILQQYWPLGVITVIMAWAIVININTLLITNNVSLPFILLGWGLGLAHSAGFAPDAGSGGVGSALMCTVIVGLFFIPAYASGFIAAGTAKLQMGFGAWVGAFYSMEPGASIVVVSSIAVGILIAVHSAVVALRRRGVEQKEGMLAVNAMIPTAPAQFLGSIGTLVAAHLFWLAP